MVHVEDGGRGVERVGDDTAEDHVERVRLELEGGGHAEVAPSAPKRPEQVGIAVLVDESHLAVRRHQLDAAHVVGRKAVLAHQPAEPAAKGEAGHARGAHHAAGRGLPVRAGGAVVLIPGDTALADRPAPTRVDGHPAHEREVDHQAAIRDGSTGHVVAAASHRDLEAAVAPEVHGVADVGDVVAPRDDPWALVDQPVVDGTHIVIAAIRRAQDRAVEGTDQLIRHRDRHHALLSGNAPTAFGCERYDRPAHRTAQETWRGRLQA